MQKPNNSDAINGQSPTHFCPRCLTYETWAVGKEKLCEKCHAIAVRIPKGFAFVGPERTQGGDIEWCVVDQNWRYRAWDLDPSPMTIRLAIGFRVRFPGFPPAEKVVRAVDLLYRLDAKYPGRLDMWRKNVEAFDGEMHYAELEELLEESPTQAVAMVQVWLTGPFPREVDRVRVSLIHDLLPHWELSELSAMVTACGEDKVKLRGLIGKRPSKVPYTLLTEKAAVTAEALSDVRVIDSPMVTEGAVLQPEPPIPVEMEKEFASNWQGWNKVVTGETESGDHYWDNQKKTFAPVSTVGARIQQYAMVIRPPKLSAQPVHAFAPIDPEKPITAIVLPSNEVEKVNMAPKCTCDEVEVELLGHSMGCTAGPMPEVNKVVGKSMREEDAKDAKREQMSTTFVKRHRKTIAFDFDGVIHGYSKGWHDGTCYDAPVPGAFDFIRETLKTHNVVVISTRNVDQIEAYFEKHAPDIRTSLDIPPLRTGDNVFWNTEGVVGITNRKLAAEHYIDDRAIRFNGVWQTVRSAMAQCPWNEKGAVAILHKPSPTPTLTDLQKLLQHAGASATPKTAITEALVMLSQIQDAEAFALSPAMIQTRNDQLLAQIEAFEKEREAEDQLIGDSEIIRVNREMFMTLTKDVNDLREQLSAAESPRMKQLRECLAVACSNGNYDYDPYLFGMANGMECARAILDGTEPQYLDAPEAWLKDSPTVPKQPESPQLAMIRQARVPFLRWKKNPAPAPEPPTIEQLLADNPHLTAGPMPEAGDPMRNTFDLSKPSTGEAGYDMSIHSEPDARKWAKFWLKTIDEVALKRVLDREAESKTSVIVGLALDEDYMHGWFANAMMAMHDYLKGQERKRQEERRKTILNFLVSLWRKLTGKTAAE